MSMWDDKAEHDAGVCAACGQHTTNGVVHWIPRNSGPDVRLVFHADWTQCTPPARPELSSHTQRMIPRSIGPSR